MTFIVVKLPKVTSRFMNIMYNTRKNKKRQSKQIIVLYSGVFVYADFLYAVFFTRYDFWA